MTFLKSIFGGWLRERCFGCDQYVEDCVCHKTDETTGAPGGEGQDSRGVESPAKSGVRLPSPSPTTRSAADHLRALHDIAYCRVFGLPGGDSLSAVQYGRFAKARALDALGMDTNPAPDAAAAPTGHSGTMEVSSTLGDSWDPRNRLVYVFERLEEIMPCTDSNRPIEHHARAVVARYKKMAAELAALKVSLSESVDSGPWRMTKDNGSYDRDWECVECHTLIYCGRVPGPWGHAKECRHAEAANKARESTDYAVARLDALNGLIGLVQLVCARPDMPQEIRQAIADNHRWSEAGKVSAAAKRESEIVHPQNPNPAGGLTTEPSPTAAASSEDSGPVGLGPHGCHAVVPKYDAFQWTGDLAAFEKWFGERCPVDFGGQISVPVHKSAEGKWLGPWLRVWCGSWVIRHEGRSHTVTDAVYKLLTQTIPSQGKREEPTP